MALQHDPPAAAYPIERPQTASGEKEVPMQAKIVDQNASSQNAQPPKADSQGVWRSYTIASSQTLAELFRDNNLPVGDVFAMACVEGNDQPLSALQSGQQVKGRMERGSDGADGGGANGPVLFTRQTDGSFIRAQ